jgi:hypothetical protein
MGTPIQNDTLFLKTGQALAIGSTTVSLTGLTPAIRNGWIRFRAYAGAAGSTFTSAVITVTDGTTTENVWSMTAVATNQSLVSPNQLCWTLPFLSELGVTQINAIIVVATGAATLDLEAGVTN